MNILFVTTSFPPNEDSQTIRFLQLIRNLRDLEHQWVFLVPGEAVDSVPEGLPIRSIILRTGELPYFRRLRSFRKISRLLEWGYSNLAYYFFFPDNYRGWGKRAFKVFNEYVALNNFVPDYIISSSGSPEGHLAAMRIKKKLPEIKWIADYGDPWCFVDAEIKPWFYPISYYLEKELVSEIDELVFTTKETQVAYEEKFGVSGHVIYYGFDSADFKKESGESSELSLAHIGAAYVGNRNLIPAILAYGMLAKKFPSLVFKIIGNHSRKFETKANKLNIPVEFMGRISFKESINVLVKTNILLLMGNKGGLQIPGKVFHYIASLNPIIYVLQRPINDDAAATLLKGFEGVIFCENTTTSLKNAINLVASGYNAFASQALGRVTNPIFRTIEVDYLSNQFKDLLFKE
jgi:hypothetical protein